MRQKAILSVALTGAFLPFCVAQDITPEAREQIEWRVNLQKNWGERMSSPGAQLVARETWRSEAGGRLVVKYELYGAGLSQDVTYELFLYRITAVSPQDLQTSGEVVLDKSGRVMDGPDDPRGMIFADPALGEPFRMALISKDGKQKAFVFVVPNPINGADKQCKLSIIRLLPRFELAFIQGSGFPADAEVEFQGESFGEKHGGKLKTDANGHVDTAILPFVKDRSEGRTQIRIISPTCKPEVTLHWGVIHE